MMGDGFFRKTIIVLTCFYFGWCWPVAKAQEMKPDSLEQNRVLRIYLDCDFFDHSFFVRSIPFADFTRDPKLAQVHILVTIQHTASGGHAFTMDFIGQEEFQGRDQQLHFISEQSDTEEIMRSGLVRIIKMGLMPYVSQTSMAPHIDIAFDEEENLSFQKRTVDPWNYWIFHIDVTGEAQAEKSQYEFALANTIRAERVTEDWKFIFQFYYRHKEESYKDEEEVINSTIRNRELNLNVVRSLTKHWSFGLFGKGTHSTYQNLDLQVSLAPALEYNIFPWELSNRKVFTIGYYAGYRYNNYIQETLYDKVSEHLFYENIGIRVELVQPWGELDTGLYFSHYFQNFKYHRIEGDLDISFRVTKNLSFVLELYAESIHDQLFLPKGEATREDILLQRRQLETDYNIRAEAGIRFSFGSIYNTIVNQRF